MRNIRLSLEYDGTDFSGWQKQPERRTVQATLEGAAREVFGHPVEVIGAGRTDAGVHAEAYVCNFRVESSLDPGTIVAALNARLPDDVVVHDATDVAIDFHARFHAVARRYVYRIERTPSAIARRTRHYCRYRLDVDAMAGAITHIRGRHDFTSFTPSLNDVDPVCNVSEATVGEEDGLIVVTIEANRFLHNMVRVIVGTLIEIGRGRMRPEQMGEVLRTKDRRVAGPTAEARGLALVAVRYGDA